MPKGPRRTGVRRGALPRNVAGPWRGLFPVVAMRGPSESYSDVILRVAKAEGEWAKPPKQSPGANVGADV
jgi:hypothetical protein